MTQQLQKETINYIVRFHDETDTHDYLVWESEIEDRFIPRHGGVEIIHGRDLDGTQWEQETDKFNQPATMEALEKLLPNCTDKTEFVLRTRALVGGYVGRDAVSKEQFIREIQNLNSGEGQ